MAGAYLSYPFCGQKCTYCNFASGVLPAELEREYLEALAAEIASHNWEWTPETVYLGGGTPSRLNGPDLDRLVSGIPGRPWEEATIEAAPGTITAEIARAWRRAGITRISLGVQSFVDVELRLTARRHSASVVEKEVEVLRRAGIDEINIDLIAGLPCQTGASWRESLDWIEHLAPPHVSVYMLEIDEESRLGAEILNNGSRYGASRAPGESLTVELYELAVEQLKRQGLERYEISNFAQPGHQSRHNLKYWRLEPYAGFGADAHSFDGRVRRRNVETAAAYVGAHRKGSSFCLDETPAKRGDERFFVGLRLSDGVQPSPEEWARWAVPISRFVDAGLLERDGATLRLTERGVLLSNEVLQEFVTS
jgi:oxygen-independent coproporphyrinogen-3 oxidase